MTSTSGAVITGSERGVAAPFAIAFGFALATSSAVGASLPAVPFTTTVAAEPSPASNNSLAFELRQTTSGLPQLHDSAPSFVSAPLAQRIVELRALTGLTTDQVGRLFGVSRRSVHNWINGNAMAPQHEELAAKILSIVYGLPGASPADRRAALLDSSHGKSIFHQLVASRGEDEPLQVLGVSARNRIEL